MIRHIVQDDFSEIRKDIYTTLSLAAILGADNEQIQRTARLLMEKSPAPLKKSLFEPLINSENALEIVIDEMLFPYHEKWIGTAKINDYEYDLFYKWIGPMGYVQSEVIDLISANFLQRGFTSGRLYLRFTHPIYHIDDNTSVDMHTFCGCTQMGLKVA